MKNIVITGGNGFIGTHLTKFFVNNDCFVYVLAQKGTKVDYLSDISNIKIIFFDLENFNNDEIINKILNPIDVFYHLAWKGVSTTIKNEEEIQMNNISYGLKALKLAASLHSKKVIFTGSMSEYAYNKEMVIGNEQPSPADFYSASKVATHFICDVYARQHDINFIWCLISSIYGPGREDNNLITYSIKSFLKNEDASFTKLEQKWDYIYIDDLINALYLIGVSNNKYKVYPVGSGEVKELNQYVEIIHKMIGGKSQLKIGKLPYKTNAIDNSIADISNLKSDTGYKAKYTFEEGIKVTIEYFKTKVDC